MGVLRHEFHSFLQDIKYSIILILKPIFKILDSFSTMSVEFSHII